MIRRFPHRFHIVALSAHKDVARLGEQVAEFNPRHIILTDEGARDTFCRRYPQWAERVLAPGDEGLLQAAASDDVDVVVNALMGAVGVRPTLAALQARKKVALANKETLVAAGPLVMAAARSGTGKRLLPIDSEHSAIFQCLDGREGQQPTRLILTASGGPFRTTPAERLKDVTPEEALRHPTWRMGGKITVDSATLMNKGLEVIEACWLFDMPPEAVQVWVHPQSIVHSLVEFRDGSMLAQLGVPDMRMAIQYALTYPERLEGNWERLDLTAQPPLTFEAPDTERFPSLALAYEAMRAGGTMPAVLNAANEVAVALFLSGKLPFDAIPRVVERVMGAHRPLPVVTVEDVLEADGWARSEARRTADAFSVRSGRSAR